jgi:predicted DNA-binding ribbon-helix-helix protein
MLHAESLSKPLHRTNLYLSEFQRDSLKMLAKAEDISAAELARRILDAGLRRATKKLASRQK